MVSSRDGSGLVGGPVRSASLRERSKVDFKLLHDTNEKSICSDDADAHAEDTKAKIDDGFETLFADFPSQHHTWWFEYVRPSHSSLSLFPLPDRVQLIMVFSIF